MKNCWKWSVCLLAILCLLCTGVACAAELVGMEPALVNLLVPDGLEWAQAPVLTKGSLTMQIDSQKTNWPAAIADTGMNNVQTIVQFKAPAGVPVGGYFNYVIMDTTEDDALEALQLNEQYDNFYPITSIDSEGFVRTFGGMPYPENGHQVAEFLSDVNYLLPESNTYIYALGWYDSNKQLIGDYQKLVLSCTHTTATPFKIDPPARMPLSRIVPNADNKAQVTVLKLEDGSVTYQVEKGVQVATKLYAPEGAVSYQYGSIKSQTGGNLDADRSLTMYHTLQDRHGGSFSSVSSIRFYDASGKLIAIEQVSLLYQLENNLAWPVYDAELTPVPEDRLVFTNGAHRGGFRYGYDAATGHVNTFYLKSATSNGASKMGNLNMTVKPYVDESGKQAKYFRYITLQQNHGILGEGTSDVQQQDQEMANIPVESAATFLPNFEVEAFRKIRPEDNDIIIYIPGRMDVTYMANLVVVYWYENADDELPMKREFFWETTEPFTAVEKVKPVVSESNLDRPVQKPHIVGPKDKDCSKWDLAITSYYQEGTNARHYELELRDENGKPVDLSEDVTIYLPFPDGYSYGDEKTSFELRHYTSLLYSESRPNLNGRPVTVTPTEYGLMFTTRSFSPFIVSWEKEEPVPEAPAAPKTGDNTQLELLFLLMMASGLMAAAMLRRKAAHK